MKRWVDYLGTTAKDEVFLDWWLGDWLEVDGGGRSTRAPIVQTSTAAYCYYAQILSRAAEILGKPEDARRYSELSDRIRARFNQRFLDPATGLYAPDSQTAQVLPLYLGIAPEDKRDLIVQRLVENIHARKDHLSAGFVGYLYLLYGLTAAGRTDLAYTIATQPDYPGWANMLKDGGTTLWEAWNGNAYNFSSLGAVDAWFYQALAGINPDPQAPGFDHTILRPGVVGDLTWVRAHYDSVHGRIAVDWRREGGRLHLRVTVPANTTATVYVPTPDPAAVHESGRPLAQAPGVKPLSSTPDAAVCEVVAGTYDFEAPAP
jgi:alpha-L-rhamnosidase